MPDKNIDMFKLVEEVEKQKKMDTPLSLQRFVIFAKIMYSLLV